MVSDLHPKTFCKFSFLSALGAGKEEGYIRTAPDMSTQGRRDFH